jgi:hypothetical protein
VQLRNEVKGGQWIPLSFYTYNTIQPLQYSFYANYRASKFSPSLLSTQKMPPSTEPLHAIYSSMAMNVQLGYLMLYKTTLLEIDLWHLTLPGFEKLDVLI